MATTAFDSIPVGTMVPNFELPDVLTGKKVTLAMMRHDFSQGLLIIFLCRHCPYVKHVRGALNVLAKEFMSRGIGFVGISANDAEDYPEDAPEGLRDMVMEERIPFPILYDETQEVAKSFTASCTPDFFLFDASFNLAYHGRLDASTPKNGLPLTGKDLRLALEAVCRGETIAEPFPLAIGCSIKWKKERK